MPKQLLLMPKTIVLWFTALSVREIQKKITSLQFVIASGYIVFLEFVIVIASRRVRATLQSMYFMLFMCWSKCYPYPQRGPTNVKVSPLAEYKLYKLPFQLKGEEKHADN